MEFETKTDSQSPEISDADRLRASTKTLQITPIHSSVVPDELEEDGTAIAHANGEALATIASESEDTSAYADASVIAPLQSVATRRKSTYIICAAAIIMLAGGILAYLQFN
mgnify:CR=1 FL=1